MSGVIADAGDCYGCLGLLQILGVIVDAGGFADWGLLLGLLLMLGLLLVLGIVDVGNFAMSITFQEHG